MIGGRVRDIIKRSPGDREYMRFANAEVLGCLDAFNRSLGTRPTPPRGPK